MECIAKIVNGFSQLTIFAKPLILDVWQVSEFASVPIYCPSKINIPLDSYELYADKSKYQEQTVVL